MPRDAIDIIIEPIAMNTPVSPYSSFVKGPPSLVNK